jgi:hypothetical protein
VTEGAKPPLSAARIGFFVGGACGVVLSAAGVSLDACLWIPGGALLAVFLASRRAPVDLADGLKGGAVCGLLAALVLTVNLGLAVARSPAEFARVQSRAVAAARAEQDRSFAEFFGSVEMLLAEMEQLGKVAPFEATARWLALYAVADLFVVASSVMGGLVGALLFRGKAPPEGEDALE